MSASLSGTLWVLPLVATSFWLLGRWAEKLGSRSGVPFAAPASILLVVLLLLAIGSRHTGLGAGVEAAEPVLMAGFALWLLIGSGVLAWQLAEVTSRGDWRRPPWPFFVLPLTLYLGLAPWMVGQRGLDGDEPYYLLIAHSLAYDLDTDLTNNYAAEDSLRFSDRVLEPEFADPVRADGRLYSRHSPALPALLAPAYRLAGRWGAVSLMMAMTAVVGWLSLSLAWCRGDSDQRSSATVVWALLVLTPPVLLYSHQIWTEIPAALLLLVGLHQIWILSQNEGGRSRAWLALSLVLVLLPLLKLRFAVLSLSLLALGWWRGGRSKRQLLAMVILVSAVVGGVLLYNQISFDKPFKDHTLDQLLRIQGRPPVEYLRGAAGLFWDCAFGLFGSNPLWLLLIPGVVLLIAHRTPLLVDLLVCGVPYFLLVSPRLEWYGAWSPPFRFGIVLLPLMSLVLLDLGRERWAAGAKLLVTGLALVALAVTLLWIAVPGWTYNLATGTSHLIDHLSLRWVEDVGRFFPSMVRLRTATWLVPLMMTLIAAALWWRPQHRPRAAVGWGAAAMLLVVAGLPPTAAYWPTGSVDFEDRQVEKRGGELFPGPWVPFRPRYRGGWSLDTGGVVRVPINSGGRRCTIEVDYLSRLRPGESKYLTAEADTEALGRWRIEPGSGWQTTTVQDVEWPTGADLVLRLEGDGATTADSAVILDRARFRWH